MNIDGIADVIVVDDSTFIRERFESGLPGLNLVAAFSDVDALLTSRPAADVVVLDLRLKTPSDTQKRQGSWAIRETVQLGYRTCVYTDEGRKFVLARCLRDGASGVVHKSDSTADACEAFRRVAAGEMVITPSLTGLAEFMSRQGRLPSLTDKQIEVLHARARGERWQDISERLYISDATARDRMQAVILKMSAYLQESSAADIERLLGLAPGDLFYDE